MKIVDIYKSVNDTTKFILQRNKKITQYLNNFDALVRANGYQTTEKTITAYLNSISTLTTKILNYYAETNKEFSNHYTTYKSLETQLRQKISSGISYE